MKVLGYEISYIQSMRIDWSVKYCERSLDYIRNIQITKMI